MDISFQRLSGDASLGIVFFWKMTMTTNSRAIISDHFIPELFFDYFFIKEGQIRCVDKARNRRLTLPHQGLKTLHTRRILFRSTTPLVVFGVRCSLKFAESFWDGDLPANSFLKQKWINPDTADLESFAAQARRYIQTHQTKRLPYPMLSPDHKQSNWLVHFSPRHKRRLYKLIFGLSRKELENIRNLHVFLEQSCDFTSQSPRIIQYVNPEVFHDQPHLNHTFKKLTGFSPVEYFQANSILQDHLMSASYNEIPNS
jgi:AraC-like DNA-binding protein